MQEEKAHFFSLYVTITAKKESTVGQQVTEAEIPKHRVQIGY